MPMIHETTPYARDDSLGLRPYQLYDLDRISAMFGGVTGRSSSTLPNGSGKTPMMVPPEPLPVYSYTYKSLLNQSYPQAKNYLVDPQAEFVWFDEELASKEAYVRRKRQMHSRLYFEEYFFSKLDEARKISEFDWVDRYGHTREAWARIDDAMMAQALASNIGKTEAFPSNSRLTCVHLITGNMMKSD